MWGKSKSIRWRLVLREGKEENLDELTTEVPWEDIRLLKGYLFVEGFECQIEEIWIFILLCKIWGVF